MQVKVSIIRDGYHSAAFNMAADLYLLKNCIHDPYIYVRFYHWIQPTITIGNNQIPEKILDLKKVKDQNVSWIRRPTGGRAVFHHNDITYSCVFSKKIKKMGKTIPETYTIISHCLKKGLEKSGVACQSNDSLPYQNKFSRESKLPCFLAPNKNEIMVNQKKLIGSAQKRTSVAVLQQGSIPLTESFRKLPLYQQISMDECNQQMHLLQTKCICIHECLEGYLIKNLVDNLIHGFEDVLSLPIEIRKWTLPEEEKIETLALENRFIEKWQQSRCLEV